MNKTLKDILIEATSKINGEELTNDRRAVFRSTNELSILVALSNERLLMSGSGADASSYTDSKYDTLRAIITLSPRINTISRDQFEGLHVYLKSEGEVKYTGYINRRGQVNIRNIKPGQYEIYIDAGSFDTTHNPLFKEIQRELKDKTPESNLRDNAVLYPILTELFEELSSKNDSRLNELLRVRAEAGERYMATLPNTPQKADIKIMRLLESRVAGNKAVLDYVEQNHPDLYGFIQRKYSA